MNVDAIVFQGEVQLLRWSDTSTQGATITLQLADPAELERFKDMTLAKGKQAGQRLAIVMVEIGDDEHPVCRPSETRMDTTSAPDLAPKTAMPSTSPKPGNLCILACTFSADPKFWEWAEVKNEAEAKRLILTVCAIDSRKELDTVPYAMEHFHEFIRKPFLEWKELN